jgi:uncharacterized protein YndB with AHSA1/START domain
MVDILHRIGTETASPDAVYEALTTVDGLAGWWTDDVQGNGEVGGVLEFRFPPVGGFDMEVLELRPRERVAWRVVDGPAEFMHHCSTKWASFLLSLKSLVETGKGAPAPRDVPISDWH